MSPTRAGTSKKGTDEKIGRSRRSHLWFAPVIADLRGIFPKKLAQNLASRAGRHTRICEFWIAGTGAPDGEALARLICSDIGDRVLDALTADCKHPWAENVRRTHEVARLRKQAAETARRLAALEEGL
jgi:hypothetical protein